MIEDIVDGSVNRDRVELVFKSQPNFEDLKGSSTTTRDMTGVAIQVGDQVVKDAYHVTVRATEMTAVGGGPARAAELDVHVQVTNVNEGGSVSVKWLQPEVGTALPATLSDPDKGTTIHSWQWYRAKVANPNSSPDLATLGDADSEWEEITAEDASGIENEAITYMPAGTGDSQDASNPRDGDEGWHLLVRVVYDDRASENDEPDDTGTPEDEDTDRLAFGITANPVRQDVHNDDNNSPDFQASNTERTIPEDTAVGDPVGLPVMVRVNEDNDTLTYELVMQCRTDAGEGCDPVATPPQISNLEDGNDAVVVGDLDLLQNR